MRKMSIKAYVKHTGFHFFQLQLRSSIKPTIRVMNYDMRPNTGKRPFEVGLVDVSVIADALANPKIRYGARVRSEPYAVK